jgi:hypothetical protein
LRFQVATPVTQLVTFTDLLDCMLIATSATAVYQQYDFVRVKFVEVWCASITLGIPVTVSVTFNGGSSNGAVCDGRIISDTVMGSEPAHVKAYPDPLSICGQWQTNNSTSSAFTLVTPANAIVDVMVEYKNVVSAPELAQVVAVGATIGQTYYRGLDGVAIATTKFVPITGNQATDAI